MPTDAEIAAAAAAAAKTTSDATLQARVDDLAAKLAKTADSDTKEFLKIVADSGQKTLAELTSLKTRIEAADAATSAAREAETKEKQTKQEREVTASIKAALKEAGAVDVDFAAHAIKPSDVKVDDAGQSNISELVAKVKAGAPFAFKAANTSAAGEAPKPGDPQQKLARDMTPEEHAAALRKLGVDPSRLRRR